MAYPHGPRSSSGPSMDRAPRAEPRPAPFPLTIPRNRKSTITVTDIPTHLFRADVARITDCVLLASYNLLAGESENILVPGLPARWTPASRQVTLSRDSGEYHRDENAARFPEHPMEPAVRALFDGELDFSTRQVDVFACGSTLGHLLRFVRQRSKPFSFVVHLVGNTAFFIRRECSPVELIENIRGYGQAFVERSTTWEAPVRGSTSHQRIVHYRFGGKRVLVRFGADAYIRDERDEEAASKAPDEPARGSDQPIRDGDHLVVEGGGEGGEGGGGERGEEGQDRSVSRDHGAVSDPRERISRVTRVGRLVPQHAVVDIKTRASRKKEIDILEEELPRLWLRQVPWFILARHTDGVFGDTAVKDVSDTMRAWESRNIIYARRLAALIDTAVRSARDTEAGKIEVRGDEEKVEFYDLSALSARSWEALPEELAKMWELGGAIRRSRDVRGC